MNDTIFIEKTKKLIDNIKTVCGEYGLGNTTKEFDVIMQIFLYKFLNDKFSYELKQVDKKLANSEDWEATLASYSEDDFEMLTLELGTTAILKREYMLTNLYNRQSEDNIGELFSNTLISIAVDNIDLFSIKTESGAKIKLFEGFQNTLSDTKKLDKFARALLNKLVEFSFESVFSEKYDFFATIFEYLIKDYNSNSGGKYAEYYTPHSVARIMASILVTDPVKDVKCYDPSAGSGTLLMCLAHAIGEDKCSIFSQDVSEKSTNMLKLNLILNKLVHSLKNAVNGNTIKNPQHKGVEFDYIVSNPPFKLDFSEYSESLPTDRFFAGVPGIPKKSKEKMAIYTLFLQHVINSLSEKGKAAVVVPTGFLTAGSRSSSIEYKIRKRIIDDKMLKGVVSMPSNIFANTGTNVSVIFLDKTNKNDTATLFDASNLGTKTKVDKNQKTVLSKIEEAKIIDSLNNKEEIEDLSSVVNYSEIIEKNYSFSAGQYFDIKIEYNDITHEEFESKILTYKNNLEEYTKESNNLFEKINKQFKDLKYDF